MTSIRRIEANRRNAQNSTGPRTQAGKERSKRNAIKHGLRSEDVVLPTEDPRAFQEHLEAWVEDWQPPSMARQHLVEQAAVASWRLKRCVRLETARITRRAEDAYKQWAEDEAAGVEAEAKRLDVDPAGALDELTASRAGVDRLIRIRSAEPSYPEPRRTGSLKFRVAYPIRFRQLRELRSERGGGQRWVR
jgi:hypothetical protein